MGALGDGLDVEVDGVPHEWAHASGPSDLVKRYFEGEVSHTEFEQELFKRCI